MSMVGVEEPVGAGRQPDRPPDHPSERATADELASHALRVIPALGLSPAHERVVTARAETFLDAALGGQATTNDTRRQARRLVAVLRATGNQPASPTRWAFSIRTPSHTADRRRVRPPGDPAPARTAGELAPPPLPASGPGRRSRPSTWRTTPGSMCTHDHSSRP